MVTNFEKDLSLEIKFKKYLKAILGGCFIVQDKIQDLEKGTDFLLFDLKPIKVAARLRRYKYLSFKNEFTIRWKRISGVKTEIHKIQEGLVDYILYGFINKEESKIIRYFIGDFKVFNQSNVKPIIYPNNPLDSYFAVYKLNQFPENFIIKQWETK